METEIYKNLSLENLPNEEWRFIPDYSNYMVSNLGRFKNLKTNKILRQYVVMNYLKVPLRNDYGIRKMVASHRVIALVFIGTDDKSLHINHKDENKLNNVVDNLEFCTIKYNANYGTRNYRMSKTQRNDIRKSKKIQQYDLDGNFIQEWDSICEAGRAGYDRKAISNCCHQKEGVHTANGFLWKFSNDDRVILPYVNPVLKPVLCYDKNGEFLKEYESAVEACKELNLNSGAVCYCSQGKAKQTKGYIFKYKR